VLLFNTVKDEIMTAERDSNSSVINEDNILLQDNRTKTQK